MQFRPIHDPIKKLFKKRDRKIWIELFCSPKLPRPKSHRIQHPNGGDISYFFLKIIRYRIHIKGMRIQNVGIRIYEMRKTTCISISFKPPREITWTREEPQK